MDHPMLLNGQLVAEAELLVANRGFRYGDGFFETIIAENGALRHWPHHAARIRRGAAALHLDFGPDFLETLAAHLLRLAAQYQHLAGAIRLRWQCWRAKGGLYQPVTNRAEWLATAERQAIGAPLGGYRADFAATVRTAPSVLSFLKGPNAPLYTLAAIEKQARVQDELILLSPDGFVAEATAAAVFWLKNGTLFTPAADAVGAVAGVGLAALLAKERAAGRRIEIGCYPPEDLFTADGVATVNVGGVRWLSELAGRSLSISGFFPC